MDDRYGRRQLVAGILLLIFFLLALIGEAMQDRAVRVWLGVVFSCVASLVVLLWLLVGVANAHDHEHPELNDWYMGLKSNSHVLCCDGHDATHLADPDWESRDGHYRVKLEDGKWYDVPDSAVVNEPNRDGRALVWTYPIWMGGEKGYGIRCFLPGAGA